MTDIEAQQAIYRKADKARVDAMRANRHQSKLQWDQLGYPAACWALRARWMAERRVSLDSVQSIRFCAETDENGSYE